MLLEESGYYQFLENLRYSLWIFSFLHSFHYLFLELILEIVECFNFIFQVSWLIFHIFHILYFCFAFCATFSDLSSLLLMFSLAVSNTLFNLNDYILVYIMYFILFQIYLIFACVQLLLCFHFSILDYCLRKFYYLMFCHLLISQFSVRLRYLFVNFGLWTHLRGTYWWESCMTSRAIFIILI